MFDMEYGRWLEEDNRHMSEIRTGLQAHLSDNDLRLIVDGYIAHFDEIFRLKAVAAKADVFHLIIGTWMSPAERCFIWMAGFRPSDLIKVRILLLLSSLCLGYIKRKLWSSFFLHVSLFFNINNIYRNFFSVEQKITHSEVYSSSLT